MRAFLFELIDYLYLIANDIFLINQIDVLYMPIVEYKVVDIIAVQFARFFYQVIAGGV